jgi:hypothetical protein
MAWGGFILTNAGRNLLAKVQAGTITVLNITRFGIGDGTYAGSYSTITNLVSQKQSVPLRTKNAKDQFTNIDGYFSNEGLAEGFYFREWGIFAMDGLQEILYAYDNAGADAEYIAPDGGVRYEKMLKAALSISADTAVTINTSGAIYATIDDIVSNIELHNSNEEAHPDIREQIGDKANLVTEDKTNLVAALNEVKTQNNSLDTEVVAHKAESVSQNMVVTRDLSLAGNQIVSGFSKKPKSIDIIAYSSSGYSRGNYSENGQICFFKPNASSNYYNRGARIISLGENTTDVTNATIAINSDNTITLTWSKSSAGATGTATIFVLVAYHGED